MEYRFSKQTLLFSFFIMLFGMIITIIETVFVCLFDETLYVIMLAFSSLLTISLILVTIYAKTYKVVIDDQGFTIRKFGKIKNIPIDDSVLSKIRLILVNRNVDIELYNKDEKKFYYLSLKSLSDEMFKNLNDELNSVKKNVKIEIMEDVKYNVK